MTSGIKISGVLSYSVKKTEPISDI